MTDLSPAQRISYSTLSYLYWFTHWTSSHRFLGLCYSTLLKTALLFLLLVAWIRRWGQPSLLVILAAILIIYLLYAYAKRAGYFRFVPGAANHTAVHALDPLPHYQRVPVKATGVFSLEHWEKHVLFRPAHYWQAPRGGHGIMVAHEPGRYLYQFFDAPSLISLQRGWILYGRRPSPALAISFHSIWGPELVKEPFRFFGRATEEPPPIQRAIYLSFEDPAQEQVVWLNIARDVGQAQTATGQAN